MVLFEEEGGNPLNISVDIVSVTKVCGHVSDSNPPPVISWKTEILRQNKYRNHHGRRPKVQLRCPPRKYISKITFASFGSPLGDCNSYAIGNCHSINSMAIVEKVSFFLVLFCLSILCSRKKELRISTNGYIKWYYRLV